MASFQPATETLKEKVEREGIDVPAENLLVSLISRLGRRYMLWKYGKPDASINREIIVLLILIPLYFVPIFYTTLVLKTETSIPSLYVSMGFLIVGLVLIMVFSVIYKRRCPQCRGYFGIEGVDSKKVAEKEVYRTETQIKMEKIYRNIYRCAFCGHTFTRNESEYEIVPIN